ncbi:Abi family protein [Desulfobacter sp.]|uniref:Abi family protein n=1 Tax=Desulfobacter sp. TaxID=2294 RepID=UPI003D14ED1E
MKYTKPPLTIDDQINLLTSRGMTIPDPARTARYLSHISYFRLRGYWIPFEKEDNGKDHHFKAGTSFENVLDLYIFDRKFRLLILEAIERVEVSLRAHFANELGVCYGSHFYLDADYIHNTRIQSGLIDSLKAEIDRMTITMKLPRKPRALSAMLNPKTERYIGNTAIMLGYFLKLISPGTSWPERMRKLIQNSPGIRPSAMGFNENWTDLPVWNTNG